MLTKHFPFRRFPPHAHKEKQKNLGFAANRLSGEAGGGGAQWLLQHPHGPAHGELRGPAAERRGERSLAPRVGCRGFRVSRHVKEDPGVSFRVSHVLKTRINKG